MVARSRFYYPGRNLNHAPIQHDHVYEPMADLSARAGNVTCIFRNLAQRLSQQIARYSHVCGCVAWLTDETVLRALAGVSCSIIVQKEDFLRPDVIDGRRLRELYASLHCDLDRYDFAPNLLHAASVCGDPTMQPMRCVGNHNSDRSPAHPRMHNKFFVFCKWERFVRTYEAPPVGPPSSSTFDDDVDMATALSLKHVPEEVWTYARTLSESDDVVIDILEREDARLCRGVPPKELASEGLRRWQHIWSRHRQRVSKRLSSHVPAALRRYPAGGDVVHEEHHQLVPKAVWTGSFNPTANGGLSLENAMFVEDDVIAKAYMDEFGQIAMLSEDLDWQTEWMSPDWRIGS